MEVMSSRQGVEMNGGDQSTAMEGHRTPINEPNFFSRVVAAIKKLICGKEK
jgi:hypothetical protein